MSESSTYDAINVMIVKRIAQFIIATLQNQAGGAKVTIDTYKGASMALAFCFEEMTGRSAANIKPKELLKWALSLPKPEKRLVTLN